MSNGIYDILGKLNGLQPKDNPVSMSAEPVYESIDPQDITPAVDSLEEKYQNFLAEETVKRSQQKDAEISRGEPELVKLLNKARLERPSAASDTEALAYQMVKANKELEKANAANDEQETKIADLQAKVSASPTAKPVPVVAPTPAPVAQPTAAAPVPVAPAARPSAPVLRMPTPAQAEVPATTAEPDIKSIEVPTITKKTTTPITQKSSGKVVQGPWGPIAQQPNDSIDTDADDIDSDIDTDADDIDDEEKKYGTYNESLESNKKILKEERQEGDPLLGVENYGLIGQAYKKADDQVILSFSGNKLTLTAPQVYGLVQLFDGMDPTSKEMFVKKNLSFFNSTLQLVNSPQAVNLQKSFPTHQKNDTAWKRKQILATRKYNPKQLDLYGNPTMENKKPNSILEAVTQVEEGKKLKEAAKPDFLDLDKDGDTDEPMKSAAKSAKDHEPAEVDSDAVAKRKRLQALKDKQEDERAEKGDDYKSASRFVKGRAYGGSAQKDDEDKDLDESGLQAYLGKKKYGKEGMKALQQAGRDGASKEKMAMLRAKHDKMDEVAPPGAKAERMVKHIKKGYSKDGNLSKREKGIAYATAWKAHNKGQVEEGTNFGDTIKNSEGKMTKVTVKEGKDAIRNHPIYTTKEAWDHYSQELAEQEMMEQSMMEAPAVDVQQELDEIAKLAGLAPKMENLDPMVPNDSASPLTHTEEGMGCTMEELEEAASRKDFRRVADRIANMKDRDEAAKLGHAFADDFEQANPRFKRKMFLTACGLDEAACNMRPGPATIMVGEEAMDEGNEFTKARLDAIAQGKDTFSVGGKTYNVSGDTSDEKTQVESVNEDINVNITANGEQDALNLLRKLSGMAEVPQVTGIAIPMGDESTTCGACGSSPCGCEESVEEERDIELANTPHEKTAPITAVTTDAGGGLGGVKKQYPLAANRGANPIEENLWTAYETMINDLKA